MSICLTAAAVCRRTRNKFFLIPSQLVDIYKKSIGDGVTVPYNNFYDVAAFTIHLLQQVDFNQNEFVN